MELPCVVLRTKDRDYFLCIDGYGGLINSELETLLQQSREVVLSLEKELEQRQVATKLVSPNGISECCEKIQKSVASLKILERLDDRAAKLVDGAVETMTTPQTVRASKVYQMFLHDILRHCGRGLVLLCAASLGRQRVIALNLQDRTQLVQYVKNHKTTLDSSTLDSLATKYKIPHDNELCQFNSISPLGARTRKRQLSVEDSSQSKHTDSSESHSMGLDQRHHDTVPGSVDIPHAQTLETSHTRVTNQTFEQDSSRKEGVLSAVIQNTQDASSDSPSNTPVQARPADHEEVLYLKFAALLSFLQQYQNAHPNLKMTCPWRGVPLPSIDINLESPLGLSAKIEFSYESSTALIQYILVSRTAAAKVSN